MDSGEFLVRARLAPQVLEAWIAAGWLMPRGRGVMREFAEVDVARAYLILDLRKLGVNDEGIPIVLDLVDQVHGLRRLLRELLAAMQEPSRSEDDWAAAPVSDPDRGRPH
jgi:chaperone modulatory protein CbpM